MKNEQTINVKITADDKRFDSTMKADEKAIGKVGKAAKAAKNEISDMAKARANVAGMVSSKFKDTGLGGFIDDVAGGTSSLEKFFGPATVAAGAITGIASAAVVTGKTLFDMAASASDYGSELADAQAKTGLAAESLSALRYQANLSGSDFGAMSGAISKFSKLVGDAAKGSDDAKAKLEALGIDPQEAVRDLDGALGKAFQTINDATPGVNQMNASMDAFGKKGPDLIPTIRGMNGNFAELKKQASALGVVLTEEDVAAADAFGDQLDMLKMQATAASAKFALQFAPEITGAMGDISKYLSKNKEDWAQWGQGIADNIRGIRNLIQSEEVGAIRGFIKDLGGAINEYNPAMWGVKAIKKSGKESREAEAAQWKNLEIFNDGSGISIKSHLAKSPGVVDENQLSKSWASSTIDKMLKAGATRSVDVMSAAVAGMDKDKLLGGALNKKDKAAKKAEFKLSSHGQALVTAADKLGISPLDLATIISYETRGTFSPTIKGGKGGNYTGLIQFGKDEYQKYKVGQNKTFESQLMNSVVPFFKDRFAGVGRETFGANISDLYKTVNGGNPNVSGKASDGNGTINEHVARMVRDHKPKALNRFFGDSTSNIPEDISKLFEEKKIDDGAKALAAYEKEYLLLGATSEKVRVEFELMSGVYDDLSNSEKDYFRNLAVTRDMIDQSSKGRADYNSYLEKLTGSYDDLYGVQKTATAEFEEQLAAAKASGVWIDAASESYARLRANLIDLGAEEAKQAQIEQEGIARLEKLDGVVTDFGLTIKAFAKPTELDRFYKVIADPDITKAIEARAKALGMTAAELKKLMESAAIDKVIGAELDYSSAGPRYVDQSLMAKPKKGMGEDFSEGFFGNGRLAQMQSDADVMKSTIKDLGAITSETFDNMAGAVGSAVEGWALYGDSIGVALQKATAAELAHIAGVATVNAIYSTALGFMRLAEWDLAAAGNAFISAGIWAGVAGGTALGAKAVAGDSFKKDKGDSKNSTQNPSEYFQSDNESKSMNYLRQSQSGSSGFQQVSSQLEEKIGVLSDSVKELKGHIGSVTPGDMLTNAVKQRPGLVTETVTKELGKNSTTATAMGRRLGMK